MVAILKFSQKLQKKKKKYLYLKNRARQRDFDENLKLLTRRVSVQGSHPDFPKKILFRQKLLPFSNFLHICKTQKCLYLCAYWPTGYLSSHPNFPKKNYVAKIGGYFEFLNFSQKLKKKQKMLISMLDRAILMKFLTHRVSLRSSRKKAYVSKTMLDRAISTKLLIRRVSLQSSHPDFQNIFVLPKMPTILIFQIFSQNWQTTKMLISRKPC